MKQIIEKVKQIAAWFLFWFIVFSIIGIAVYLTRDIWAMPIGEF
jgi:hypothetical protein